MSSSELDAVPGLGQARKTALLKHFGSVKRLRAATVEQISEVPGFGRRTAETVHAALNTTTATVDNATGSTAASAGGHSE
jgi:excinuclease ABC subunit C